jgi:CrcB protein
MPIKLILIFLGSGVGGVARYVLAGLVQGACGSGFPFGTLVVNVTGCLAMGFLATLFAGLGGPMTGMREEYRLAILVGVLGGYTTFSSFSRETLTLLQEGQWPAALLNITLSNVLCLIGVWAGWALAMRAGRA